jgi:hypothetical protein
MARKLFSVAPGIKVFELSVAYVVTGDGAAFPTYDSTPNKKAWATPGSSRLPSQDDDEGSDAAAPGPARRLPPPARGRHPWTRLKKSS